MGRKRTCDHRIEGLDAFVQVRADGRLYDPTRPEDGKPIAWRCLRCRDYANLGAATEDSFAVLDEIRAAEFAADRRNHKALKYPRACLRGGRPFCEVGGCDGCDLWDLARCIAETTTRPTGAGEEP